MAGVPYALNYLAPQARDAERDLREQRADAAQDANALRESVQAGDIVTDASADPGYGALRWWTVERIEPGQDWVLLRGFRDASRTVWSALDGMRAVSEEEQDRWQAQADAAEEADAQDRWLRWGGGWDND